MSDATIPMRQKDETFRVNCNLTADSIVFDVGGYKGKWTGKIFACYGCNIHVFEPIAEFADIIEQKFIDTDKVHVHRFGLGHETGMFPISVMRDSSSFYRDVGDYRDVPVRRAADFILASHIETIDLMEINIEGGEYDLLNHLIESGLMSRIKNIQIQFHDFMSDAKQQLAEVQRGLKETHELVFRFLFIWEGWKIKE